jgi:hypothetical protein
MKLRPMLLLAAATLARPAIAADCDYTGESHDILANGFHFIELTLCEDHFPYGSPEFEDVMAVIDDYNRVQNTSVTMAFAGWEPHTDYDATRTDDNVNKIDFTEEGCAGDDCSFSGRAKPWKNVWGRINECDVVLDEGDTWTFGLRDYTTRTRGSFRNTLSHELGHCVGFDHTAGFIDVPNIMGSLTGKWLSEGEIDVQAGLKAFDHGHLRFHYPSGNGGLPDLFYTNYQVDWSDGSYVCEENSQLDDTRAARGQEVELTWTRMNTGPVAVTDSFHTNVVLSTDRTIGDADDIRIKRWVHSGSVPASSTLYAQTSFVVSEDWPAGTYWVAFVVDADDEVEEADETNNIHFLAERLTIADVPDLAVEITGRLIMHRILFGGDTEPYLNSVSYSVTNLGTATHTSSTLVLRNEEDGEIASATLGTIAPGATVTGTFSRLSFPLADRDLTWTVEADARDVYDEADEWNNDDSFVTDYYTPEPPDELPPLEEPKILDPIYP